MSEDAANLKYRNSHEWARDDGDGIVTVGISDHAQEALGDMVFVELPEVGGSFSQGDACAVVESVKAASDIYAPVSGEVVDINGALEDDPGLVNTSPYGEGWLFQLKAAKVEELDALMSADQYAASVGD